MKTDVSDRASVIAAADAAERAFGKLRVAVSNAGVSMHNQALADISPADWNLGDRRESVGVSTGSKRSCRLV